MADAAKAARGSFNDIKQGSGEMGRAVGGNMREAREGVMLLGEEFGVHLPRGLTSFIASLGPIAGAMETAFPFLAIITGAVLLLQHLSKLREEGEKLTESQMNFGTVTANVLNGLNDKLLQAGIRADELNGNHLAELEKQLTLIDHQSLKELEQSFAELDKASDAVMANLKTSWYQMGTGSEGAKHALDEFKSKYDLLLAQGKNKEASDLLAGTLQSAKRIQELQQQAKNPTVGANGLHDEYEKHFAAMKSLKEAGTGISDKEVASQNILVDALNAQVVAEQKIHDLKLAQQNNARTETHKTIDADDDKMARAQADEMKRVQEEQDKEQEQNYKDAVERIQQAEQDKINATDKGTAARLAAIDAAIKDEQSKGLQETSFYKQLLQDRVNTARQISDEEAKLKSDAGKESAEHAEKLGELQIAAERERGNTRLQQAIMTGQDKLKADLQFEKEEYDLQQKSLKDQIAALDQHAQDYQNKLKQLQDKEEELAKAHANRLQQIQDQAASQQYSKLNTSMIRMEGEFAQGFAQVLMGHKTFANMMNTLGDQVVTGMMQEAIKSALAMDFGKEKEAAAAARKFFLAGAHFPFPVNIVMAPALAAMAFASMMAFAEGGIVPGVGVGDVQPAMLTPGEAVIPKKMTEQLQRASESDSNPSNPVHLHFRPTYHVSAIDGASVHGMLQKHADEFSKHFHSQLRKMNR